MLAWTCTWENKAAGCVSLPPMLPCLGAPCLVSAQEEMPLWVPVSHQPLSVVQAYTCQDTAPLGHHLHVSCPLRPPAPAHFLGREASQLVRTVGLRVGHLALHAASRRQCLDGSMWEQHWELKNRDAGRGL